MRGVDAPGVSGRTVVLAGGTSAAGLAISSALVTAGARVIVTGRDAQKLLHAQSLDRRVATAQVDLTDERQVLSFVENVHTEFGDVDGVFHLVGGWRGGGGIAGQSETDFRYLERTLTALRHLSRALHADLVESAAGRTAIVSSTAVVNPAAGGANYAAVKSASEAWIRAVGQGLASGARAAGRQPNSSAAIFRVRTLKGLEHALAHAFVQLWDHPAAEDGVSVVTLDATARRHEPDPGNEPTSSS